LVSFGFATNLARRKKLYDFYEIGYPGSEWKVDARVKWKAPLVNERMPYQALISQAGDLVTLNEHGSVGYRNAVVIYDRDGHTVRAFALDDLLPPDEISTNENTNKIAIPTSSRWWSRDAKYYFYQQPSRLYVVLPSGTALEFFLADGKFSYGARSNPHAGEEAEIWRETLRFSSITDVLAAGSK
jgi:hypothetical protein